ncbi:MAG TPA: hypothetical protein VFV74_05835 [Burkholderiales bacterium]|nr:hypothetical protein [Burkholderiales bacterium]
MGRRAAWLVGIVASGAIGAGAYLAFPRKAPEPPPPAFSYAELTGSIFLPLPKDGPAAPRVRELEVPSFDNATAIWGATGRGPFGHIWIGVSASSDGKSAHLFEYAPQEARWYDRGDVLGELKAAGLYRSGMGQIKIHSKIVPAQDGWLYFASTDEEGEQARPALLPRWGSHLWRIDPRAHTWEHLLAVPEGLVAVSGVGRYVYALGYWDHVLYQYDTRTRTSLRVVVGSVEGHVSRNFLADLRGHAYVPRLRARADKSVSVELLEYDDRLREVGATPLEHYLGADSPAENHGIVGLAYLPDGRMVFSTHVGYLYLVEPSEGTARVSELGPLHPQGEAYAPSLFAFGGNRWIAGVAQRGESFEWVVYEMQSRMSAAFPLDTSGLKKVLLYGSMARDEAGRAYLVGWASNGVGGQRPLVLQVDPGR